MSWRQRLQPLALVLVLLAGVFAMHGFSARHDTAAAAHSTSYAAPDLMAMTTVTSRTVALGDDHGRDGRHQSDFGAQTRLAVIAIAIALLLLLFSVIGWHRSGIPMALRAASRHRLSCGPPRVFALSLAQLNVLRT